MRYVKPKSLTWWAAIVPLGAGVFLAAEPLHNLDTAIEVINNMTGHASPYVLINAGLGLVGLRGAL